MENRNNLTSAYIPERKTQGEQVIIGLNGSIKSFVAASLLKIQKYNLVAVTILNSWEEVKNPSRFLSCHIDDKKLEAIRSFCRHLGITHHTLKVSSEFREEVVEKWVSAKLTGNLPVTCRSCQNQRMHLLYKKMQEVGAKKFATGHLAKIFHQDAKTTFIRTSNDETHDESFQLAALPVNILQSLLLPLSDLQLKEVEKLAENFKVQFESATKSECFPDDPELVSYLESNVPPRFLSEGDIVSLDDEERFDKHEGVHHFRFAKPVKPDEIKKNNLFVKFKFSNKNILLAGSEYFIKKKFLLTDCQLSPETQLFEPLKGFVKKQNGSECWITPKTFNSCLVELDQPLEVVENEILTITKKQGKNAKIHLTGRVRYLPVVKTEDSDEEFEDQSANLKVDTSTAW